MLELCLIEGVKATKLAWGKVVLAHRGHLTHYAMLAMDGEWELSGRGYA